MTICNMSIEAGAKAGMVAPDDTTFAYIEGRPHAPKGIEWERALDDWRCFDRRRRQVRPEFVFDAHEIRPHVSWGTNPGRSFPSMMSSRTRRRSPTRVRAMPHLGRWPTWTSSPVRRCAIFRSTPSSSAPAPIAESKICGSRRRCSRVAVFVTACGRWSCRDRCG